MRYAHLLTCGLLAGAVSSVAIWCLSSVDPDPRINLEKGTRALATATAEEVAAVFDNNAVAHPSTAVAENGLSHQIALLREATASLKSDINQLRIRLDKLATTVNALPVTQTVGDEAFADSQHPLSDAELAFQLEQYDQGNELYLADIETSVQNEKPDEQWSAEANAFLEQILQDERLTDAAVVDIDCRSTLCRVEVEHESTSFQTYFSELLEETDLHPAVSHTQAGEGWNTTILYLERDGFELPAP